MTLDMYSFIDPVLESLPAGGVWLHEGVEGDYSGPGGTWVPASNNPPIELKLVNIQAPRPKDVQHLAGGVVEPSDFKLVHINDGKMIYPDDDGRFSALLEFSDGLAMRMWRVREADNRPWRSFCRVIVER